MTGELRRALGLGNVVANSAGLAFAAFQYLAAASLIAYVAGDSAWIPILIAGLLMVVARGLFSELNGLFPTAAGIRLWMSRALNDRLALTVTLTYLTTICLVIAADAYIIGSAITHTLGQTGLLAPLWIVAVLVAVTVVNLRGVQLAGSVQAIATSVVITATVVVCIWGLAKDGFSLDSPFDPLEGHSPADLLQAVALGVFLYSAFEWVTTTAEETRDPTRVIPRGMLIALAILCLSSALIAVAIGHLLSEAQLSTPYPQLFLGESAAGRAGLIVMMGVTAVTAVNTFNGGFITASRFLYATAREGSLPAFFTRLNDRAVPWVAVLVLAGGAMSCAVIVALTGAWEVVVATGAALEAMIYAVAGTCVFRLRRRLPEQHRPFVLRGGRPLALAVTVVFAGLAVAASTTVENRVNLVPLAILLVLGGMSLLYVKFGLPRVRSAHAARSAEAAANRRMRRERRAVERPQADT